MRQISIIIFFILIIQLPFFCQTNEKEYIKHSSDLMVDTNYCRISAKNNSSWGFINNKDEIIIPLGKYNFLNPIDSAGMILAQKGNKKGFIDIEENINTFYL